MKGEGMRREPVTNKVFTLEEVKKMEQAAHAATLKAVGESLNQISKEAGDLREFERRVTGVISVLLEGKMS